MKNRLTPFVSSALFAALCLAACGKQQQVSVDLSNGGNDMAMGGGGDMAMGGGGDMAVRLNWISVQSPVTTDLNAVFGFTANNVYAAGAGGVILHYDGTAWTKVNTNATTKDLKRIFGRAANDIWIVGDAGTIVHSTDGMTWKTTASGTTQPLNGIWGNIANNLWAVGDKGTLLRWNGMIWMAAVSGTMDNVNSLFGFSNMDVWASCDNGTILHTTDGRIWGKVPSGTMHNLNGLWGGAAKDLWAAGGPNDRSDGIITHWDGTKWTAATIPTKKYFNDGIIGFAMNEIYAGANSGTIVRYNGTSWSLETTAATEDISDIWGSSATALWAVGAKGTILRRQ